jgi:hypothetical protein
MQSWSLEFADDQGLSGSLTLAIDDGAAAFAAQVAVPGLGVVVVRAEGLWAELLCETPGEHWSVGLEAFGVRFDSEAEAATSDRGERVPVGLDVEWETPDRVVGEVLVGRARYDLDGHGTFTAPPPPTGVTKAQ